MERDDEASKWAVAYTYEAVNRHNPDRLKAHAAQGSAVHGRGCHTDGSTGCQFANRPNIHANFGGMYI